MQDDIKREYEQILRELRSIASQSAKPTLLTMKAAAADMSMSLSRLKRLVRAGAILVVRPEGKGHPLVSRTEIERFVQTWTERPASTKKTKAKPRVAAKKYDAKAEAEKIRASLRRKKG